jgi:hypothetical protein
MTFRVEIFSNYWCSLVVFPYWNARYWKIYWMLQPLVGLMDWGRSLRIGSVGWVNVFKVQRLSGSFLWGHSSSSGMNLLVPIGGNTGLVLVFWEQGGQGTQDFAVQYTEFNFHPLFSDGGPTLPAFQAMVPKAWAFPFDFFITKPDSCEEVERRLAWCYSLDIRCCLRRLMC